MKEIEEILTKTDSVIWLRLFDINFQNLDFSGDVPDFEIYSRNIL